MLCNSRNKKILLSSSTYQRMYSICVLMMCMGNDIIYYRSVKNNEVGRGERGREVAREGGREVGR